MAQNKTVRTVEFTGLPHPLDTFLRALARRALPPARQQAARENYRKFQNLPQQQRQQLRQRWQNASPQQRQNMVQRARERRAERAPKLR